MSLGGTSGSIKETYHAHAKQAEFPISASAPGTSAGYLSSVTIPQYSWTIAPTGIITYATTFMQATRLVAITLVLSAFSLTALSLLVGLIILATPFWWLLLLPTFGPVISGLLSLYFVGKKR